MEKNYNPKDFEEKLYEKWLNKGYFKTSANKDKTPFTIIMPPPNITSKLHMGHAFQQTIQDIIIRRKRMQGYEALWLPGTDHAAIATEAKVVEKLANAGISKEEIGREAFLRHIEDWYREYKGEIINQFKRMGYSCDWDRLRFTMDEQNCKAVRHVFVHLYKKGLIYRGKRIVNWCPHCRSSISDIEVDFKELKGSFWHIRYQIEGTNDYIEIATTRPETMLGDTAVAVNPKDDRYKHLVGKNVILPLLNKPIPVVADDYVEMDFGTGVVKITPAHDPNDFEVGLRHNLEVICILNDNGTMNENAGVYAGLTREKAREQIVKDLKDCGNLVKIESYTHNVGHCDRCKTIIEPLISSQWFVKMEELAKPAIKVVENDQVHFTEERFKKIYLHWMKNIKDWCISRQLWSGHRIPIFTCQDCGETIVEMENPTRCPKCSSTNLTQDEDTLDTWFSSALWPLSTLGFPEKTPELDYFYPTNVMVTAQEIIQLWVARMIFSGLEYVGEIPFKDVLINGTVKDATGKKMSKSLGNGVDPVGIIEEYGVDTLRFSLFNGVSIDMDSKFSHKKVELCRNFINKVWNASRFVLMQAENCKVVPIDQVTNFSLADKWILTELNKLIKSVDKKFEKYDIGMAASELYDFFWNKFCDWYIELTKTQMSSNDQQVKDSTASILIYVLTVLLKLLHPFIPFITEEIYLSLPIHDESIVISNWPEVNTKLNNTKSAKNMDQIMSIIKSIRNARSEKNIPDNKKIRIVILPIQEEKLLKEAALYIQKLSTANEISFIDNEALIDESCVTIVSSLAKVFLPMSGMVDTKEELERLNKELTKVDFEISRSEKMLSNPGFVNKAPAQMIENEKAKLDKNKELKQSIIEAIKALQ